MIPVTIDVALLNAFAKVENIDLTFELDGQDLGVRGFWHGIPWKATLGAEPLTGGLAVSIDSVKLIGISLGGFGRDQARSQILAQVANTSFLKASVLPSGWIELKSDRFKVTGIRIVAPNIEIDLS